MTFIRQDDDGWAQHGVRDRYVSNRLRCWWFVSIYGATMQTSYIQFTNGRTGPWDS